MAVSGAAGRTVAAPVERPDRDPVAGTEGGHAGTGLFDHAGHFVADGLRNSDPLIHLAVEDVQIGSADAAVGDPDPDLPLAGFGGCDVAHFKGLVSGVKTCFHLFAPH